MKHIFDKSEKVIPVVAFDGSRKAAMSFEYNVGFVKKYRDGLYKISYNKCVLAKGSKVKRSERGTVNDYK